MRSDKKIELWGTYPPPIGGVSIHVKRLITYLNEIQCVYLKNFRGAPVNNVKYIANVTSALREFFCLLFVPKKLIHLHSNNFKAFVLIYFLGFRHYVGITLHNKNLSKIHSGVKCLFLRLFFKRLNFIILNDPQYATFIQNKFNIPASKLNILPAFLPPLPDERLGLPNEILQFRQRYSYLISANAFKLRYENSVDIYGFDFLIELICRLKNKEINVGLLFCLPQIGDLEYFKKCQEKIKVLGLEKRIMIVQNVNLNGFEMWEISDLFVRPTTTDIEAISVKEALCCGVPVVASDVCTRPKEAILYKSGDFNDFFNKVYQCYLESPIVLKKEEGSLSPVKEILKIYNQFK